MKITFQVGDILQSGCEAIVNSANPSLLAGGGLSGAIHRAAGPEMEKYLKPFGPIKPGNATSSPSFNIDCNHVIHTVASRFIRGADEEYHALYHSYLSALHEANTLKVKTIAFPAIGVGVYRWPARESAGAAFWAIQHFLDTTENLEIKLIAFYFSDEKIKNSFIVERKNALNTQLNQMLKTHRSVGQYDLIAWVYGHWVEILDQPRPINASDLIEFMCTEGDWDRRRGFEYHADLLYGLFYQIAKWGMDFEFDIPEESIDFSESIYTYDSFLELVSTPPQVVYGGDTIRMALTFIDDGKTLIKDNQACLSIEMHIILFLQIFKSNRGTQGLQLIEDIPSKRLKEFLRKEWHENLDALEAIKHRCYLELNGSAP